ncbi:MAG: hypothetical protein ACPGUC_00205 [Gammaproteobacteria bacterium]
MNADVTTNPGTGRPVIALGGPWTADVDPARQAVRHISVGQAVIWLRMPDAPRAHKGGEEPNPFLVLWRLITAFVRGLFKGRRLEGIEGRFTVLRPRYSVFGPRALRAAMDRRRALRMLRREIKKQGVAEALLWVGQAEGLNLLKDLPDWPVVYYSNCELAAMDDGQRRAVMEAESRVAGRALLVVAPDQTRAEPFADGEVFMLHRGLDVTAFSTPAPRAKDLPKVKRIAGFFGTVNEAIDMEMLAEAAFNLSYWTFVIIGPVEVDVKPLKQVPNIQVLGVRDHDDLPGYVQHWNVSFLPFKAGAQRRITDALRLDEYLASGTPIAAGSEFPTLKEHKDLVHIAPNRLHLADAISAAYKEGRGRAAERQARVGSGAWVEEADQLSQRIRRLIDPDYRPPRKVDPRARPPGSF